MTGFADIGLTPGSALPAPAIVAPAAGMVYGSDGLWHYPPGYLLAVDAGGAAVPLNTTAETSVLNAALTNAIPAFAAVGDAVNLRAWGLCVLGATGTLTLNAYAGATKIAAGTASGNYAAGVPRGWLLDLWIELLSSTTVVVLGWMLPRSGNSNGFQSLPAGTELEFPGADTGVAVTVSTLPQSIDVKAIMSVATATSQVTCKGARARYYPKNY